MAYASRTLSVDDHLEGKVDESEHPMFLKGCTFLGSLAFEDPARQGVVDAIAQCYTAGVRVVMVTGDHVETARAVAHHLGILESGASGCGAVSCAEEAVSTMNTEGLLDLTTRVNVFARATPDDKLAILKALQASSYCVMAAGDGKFLDISVVSFCRNFIDTGGANRHVINESGPRYMGDGHETDE